MSEDEKKEAVKNERYGLPVYNSNPSIPDATAITKTRKSQYGNERKGFVVDSGSGEILSVGGIGFYEFEEVDNAKFVKLFLDGLKQATGLTKAGLAVFEVVYNKLQNQPNTDEIKLAVNDTKLPPSTYRRGVRDLLEKEFLFLSNYQGVFYVNIRYMFNGDRLAFVKGYQRKASKKTENQLDMFEQKALDAKEAEAE